MRTKAAAFIVTCAFACACTTTGVPPTKDRSPTASASSPRAAMMASASSAPPVAEVTVPTFTGEPFAPAGSAPSAVFAIEGAVVVVDAQRVGRIVGDGVEWIGTIPKTTLGLGENAITSVVGRWPDSVGALYVSSQGRAPAPTYVAITGKPASHVEAAGGGWAFLYAARVGDATVIAASSGMDGQRLLTVRGPKIARAFTPAKSACKAGEVVSPGFGQEPPALSPSAFESTTEGTLASLGTLCTQRGPAAEIWDKKTGQSRIVDLGNLWGKRIGYGAALLKGPGDALWAYADPFQPVLHYDGGSFTKLPMLPSPIANAFASPAGQLYARTTRGTIHRFADGRWSVVGRIAEPAELRSIVVDAEGTFWGANGGKVYRLRETSRERPPADDACKDWLVYLYASSSSNDAHYTYPTTRKALSTFAEASSLGFVEFGDYPKHVGVIVTSKSQGEAVVAHVKANMKDEDPKVFCHAPKNARRIDLQAK